MEKSKKSELQERKNSDTKGKSKELCIPFANKIKFPKINRNLFKIAVELGKVAHAVAAANDVDENIMQELHAMCVDEVRHINGVINFENAVKFQKE